LRELINRQILMAVGSEFEKRQRRRIFHENTRIRPHHSIHDVSRRV
jgi:hypothetical protein